MRTFYLLSACYSLLQSAWLLVTTVVRLLHSPLLGDCYSPLESGCDIHHCWETVIHLCSQVVIHHCWKILIHLCSQVVIHHTWETVTHHCSQVVIHHCWETVIHHCSQVVTFATVGRLVFTTVVKLLYSLLLED